MENILDQLEDAHSFVAAKIQKLPEIAIILGTGLGGLIGGMEIESAIPYEEIPYFPFSTVQGHAGRLISGRWAGKEVFVMQGRVHFYEGYNAIEVTFPIRVLKKLGVRILILSNAAGGLNPMFNAGDVMVIADHINLTGRNPLIGPNRDDFGPRFPDMTGVYDRKFIGMAEEIARGEHIKLHKGVYAGVLGPSLETPAETRFLRLIGADAVGMSTIPEVIVAVHCGMKIMGLSAISNVNLPDCMQRLSLEEILKNASLAGQKMIRLIEGVLKRI